MEHKKGRQLDLLITVINDDSEVEQTEVGIELRERAKGGG